MTETWTPMVKRMKRRANPGRPATGQYASYSHGAQARLRYGYRLTEGGFVIERRTPPPGIEKRYKVGQARMKNPAVVGSCEPAAS